MTHIIAFFTYDSKKAEDDSSAFLMQEDRRLADCRERIYSNAYGDYLFEYQGRQEELAQYFEEDCVQIIDDRYAVAYIPRETRLQYQTLFNTGIIYSMVPKCYGLMDASSMEASGISAVSGSSLYGYTGRGTICCVIDTGIDYQADAFIREDGTSRILGIWDQTVEDGEPPESLLYGAWYDRDRINQALKSENPLTVVPEEDTNGHGTFSASIAAGSREYFGAAPDAELLIIKLKPAKSYLKWVFGIAEEQPAFQENDIMAGLAVAVRYARRRAKPLSVCLGLGTSSGAHAGDNALAQMVSYQSVMENVFISIAAGNEGNARLHAQGAGSLTVVEFNVGSAEDILVMELWGIAPDTYSVGFETPDGSVIARIPPRFNATEQINFAIGGTMLNVNYTLVEAQSGNELVYIWMYKPLPGLWRLNVYGEGITSNGFHIWMPIRQYVQPDTYFLTSTPDVTLTSPADGVNASAVTAYNHRTGAISLEASRGYTLNQNMKPDIAAPGVEVMGIGRRGISEQRSGSSVAAAHVAGAGCLLQQWTLENPVPALTGVQLKQYLIRGAVRDARLTWPSRLWGWGILNLLSVFDTLRRGV